jgi:sporulation protein YlmC with PRC-barrel domain
MINEHSSDVVKSCEVVGISVQNRNKENLGKIEEIVLNKVTGQVHYVVLSFGGIMGLGDKYFALPWKSLSYSPAEKCFILNMEKDKLKDAPGFDKNHWPDMSDMAWARGIDDYYKFIP